MDWNEVEGKWKQLMGSAKEKWGKLTDDDWTSLSGKKEQLVGKIQERYGIAKDEADKQATEWARTVREENKEARSTAKTY